MQAVDRGRVSRTGRASAAIAAVIGGALWLAACNDAGPADEPQASAEPPKQVSGTRLLASNSEPRGTAATPHPEAPAAAMLPPDDADVLSRLFAGLADESRLFGGAEWTSGVVGASGTILEAEAVADTGCKRFRSSMDAADGSLLLVGVACERLGGWAIDELDIEATTG